MFDSHPLTVTVNHDPYNHTTAIRRDGVWFFLTVAASLLAGVLMLSGG